jgi:hypothetical protein
MSHERDAWNRTPARRKASPSTGSLSGIDMKTRRVAPVRLTARASATGSREYARALFATGNAARKTGE